MSGTLSQRSSVVSGVIAASHRAANALRSRTSASLRSSSSTSVSRSSGQRGSSQLCSFISLMWTGPSTAYSLMVRFCSSRRFTGRRRVGRCRLVGRGGMRREDDDWARGVVKVLAQARPCPARDLDLVVEPTVVFEIAPNRRIQTFWRDRDRTVEEQTHVFGQPHQRRSLLRVEGEFGDQVRETLRLYVLLESVEPSVPIDAARGVDEAFSGSVASSEWSSVAHLRWSADSQPSSRRAATEDVNARGLVSSFLADVQLTLIEIALNTPNINDGSIVSVLTAHGVASRSGAELALLSPRNLRDEIRGVLDDLTALGFIDGSDADKFNPARDAYLARVKQLSSDLYERFGRGGPARWRIWAR